MYLMGQRVPMRFYDLLIAALACCAMNDLNRPQRLWSDSSSGCPSTAHKGYDLSSAWRAIDINQFVNSFTAFTPVVIPSQ